MPKYIDHGEILYDTESNMWIPKCPGNADYDAFLASGEVAEPYIPPPPTLDEVKAEKLLEVAQLATSVEREGATILDYHMALEPDDVAYMQQANAVAHIEATAMGLSEDAPIGKLKEKWHLEDGSVRTQLHEGIPLNVHDTILAYSAMLAAEIITKQERLMQAVYDAETVEEIGAITW